ncbi:MAG: tetratricopeptide repeat protein [Cyanobacteriota bacterium]|nr:tetratricopeptide repeat protein [Cyanobacteriota bacterium]
MPFAAEVSHDRAARRLPSRPAPWRVFVSHTVEFRRFPTAGGSYIDRVERAVLAAEHGVGNMEHYRASDGDIGRFDQLQVEASDVYVGIYGRRWGTPVPGAPELSYTVQEFEAASAAGIPRLIFVLDWDASAREIDLPVDQLSDLEHGQRQQAFLDRIHTSGELIIKRFRGPDHLAGLVENSLRELEKRLALGGVTAGDAMAAEPPPPHNLPWPSHGAADLVGRQAALARLDALLTATAAPVLITGMDGVGKTALALHHLRQRLEHYGGGLVMLNGQVGLEGLVEQLEQFALVHFDLAVPEGLAPQARLASLTSHWPRLQPVLLLVDELQEPATLDSLGQGLPARFRLLATCRRQFGVASQRVPLEPLSPDTAVAMLEPLAERGPFSPQERLQAMAMAREVGGLPLALLLLGRQLARDQDLELAELLRALRDRGALARELQGSAADPLQARGLCAGFQLIWEGLGPLERRLALLLAALPCTAVPWELLARCCPPQIDPHDWQEALLGLEQQHLIERPLARMVQLHVLVHDLLAAQGEADPPALRQERCERLLGALQAWLAGISDVLEARNRERHQACLPLLEGLALWPREAWPAGIAALPLLALGRLRAGLGAERSAREALEAGLQRARNAGGDGEAVVLEAGCLVALAGLARERGDPIEAVEQCRQGLALLERAGEGLDLERAEALNGLGLSLHDLASPEAEPVLRQALAVRCQLLGTGHRQVQLSRNNLARNLARADQHHEAEALYQQALAALGDGACEVAVAIHNNRAALARNRGDLDLAHAELQRAVAMASLALGDDHPRRGELLMNLAILADELGRHGEAQEHCATAVELLKAAWGLEDPRTQDCCALAQALATPQAADDAPE